MNTWRIVLQRGQLVPEHMQSIDGTSLLEKLQVLLLQQQKLHLTHPGTVRFGIDHSLQLLEIVVCLGPIAGQDVLAEFRCRRMLQTATRFLHQSLGASLQANVFQVLSNQADNLLISLIEFNYLTVGRGFPVGGRHDVIVDLAVLLLAVVVVAIHVVRGRIHWGGSGHCPVEIIVVVQHFSSFALRTSKGFLLFVLEPFPFVVPWAGLACFVLCA